MFVVPVSLHLFGNNVLWGGALAFNFKTHLSTDKYYYGYYIYYSISSVFLNASLDSFPRLCLSVCGEFH